MYSENSSNIAKRRPTQRFIPYAHFRKGLPQHQCAVNSLKENISGVGEPVAFKWYCFTQQSTVNWHIKAKYLVWKKKCQVDWGGKSQEHNNQGGQRK